MGTYVAAFLVIFALVVGWVGVQGAARRFARRHPELGPTTPEGEGAGHGGCGVCAIADMCGKGPSGGNN
ncbi:hypothetical protein LRF89_00575 [Halorhodospira sp. 9621]|uniref:hypothetical protein n=1 Tax=Halorhodospira TaxID=85108 RepID=UPI0019144676|nr:MULTISPECIES: hypothetical protein [Halorhodospira]MBK5942375.1 hypothetical protein [Halorhodospira halophila]MCG5528159.1 hypothetical protein [Halorhodospira halophila]MCG5531927.1 hypothetical protein [Halorhodospira sp. 9621]MCG5537576.1 hypothetical protein [Halorhodospira sp. 9622]MCG5542969.1 hypothetical protein [Halorhodospira sp. 9628]